MDNAEFLNELKRLDFEDFLWVIFIIIALLNIYGDYNDKEFLKTHRSQFKKNANLIFEITLIITFLIYIYFFMRNYYFYQKATLEEKQLYLIKVLGSTFLLAGVILLIYFQTKQTDFLGTPAA